MSGYIDSPCLFCKERHVGCHDDCKNGYKEYLEEHKRIMDKKNEKEDVEVFIRERRRTQYYKTQRKYNR